MTLEAQIAATENTLSTRPASAPGETPLYEEVPTTDVYYREYFDGGMVLTHESRDEVGSPEHSVRVEIEDRYELGFSRRKLAAAQETKRGILAFVSTVGLVVAVALLTAVWTIQDALSADAPIAMLPAVEAGAVIVASAIGVFVAARELYRLHQLQAVGRLSPVRNQTQTRTGWMQ